jgi:hypothetical protein
MQRRQLAATVAAVAMSVTSAVFAIGANTGMLGNTATSPTAPLAAPVASAPAPSNAASTPGTQQNGHGEREGARDGATTAAPRQGGEHDD